MTGLPKLNAQKQRKKGGGSRYIHKSETNQTVTAKSSALCNYWFQPLTAHQHCGCKAAWTKFYARDDESTPTQNDNEPITHLSIKKATTSTNTDSKSGTKISRKRNRTSDTVHYVCFSRSPGTPAHTKQHYLVSVGVEGECMFQATTQSLGKSHTEETIKRHVAYALDEMSKSGSDANGHEEARNAITKAGSATIATRLAQAWEQASES